MTVLPRIYYLHVWRAKRPLVASRAAVLASTLPEDADRDRSLHAIRIRGDGVAARHAIAVARLKGSRIAAYYEQQAESVEFWSPGGVAFGDRSGEAKPEELDGGSGRLDR